MLEIIHLFFSLRHCAGLLARVVELRGQVFGLLLELGDFRLLHGVRLIGLGFGIGEFRAKLLQFWRFNRLGCGDFLGGIKLGCQVSGLPLELGDFCLLRGVALFRIGLGIGKFRAELLQFRRFNRLGCEFVLKPVNVAFAGHESFRKLLVVLLKLFKLRIGARFFGVGKLGEEVANFLFQLVEFGTGVDSGLGGGGRFNIGRRRCCRRDSHAGFRGDGGRHGRFATNRFELVSDVFQAVLDDVGIPVGRVFPDAVEQINRGRIFLKRRAPVCGLLGGLAILQEDEGVSVLLAGIGVRAREVEGGQQR